MGWEVEAYRGDRGGGAAVTSGWQRAGDGAEAARRASALPDVRRC